MGCTTMHPQWNDEPLAAMSGGPIVIAAATGFYLVGILSEGSKSLETGIAVPWDLIQTEFADSLVLGKK